MLVTSSKVNQLKFAETQRSFTYGWDQAYGQWLESTGNMAEGPPQTH